MFYSLETVSNEAVFCLLLTKKGRLQYLDVP